MTWFGGPEYIAWAILVGATELTAGLLIRAHHWWKHRPDSRNTIRRLQASAWIETAAVPTTSEPSPAPPSSGRGHRDTSDAGVPPAGVAAESPRPTSTPVGGPKQPVAVDVPPRLGGDRCRASSPR